MRILILLFSCANQDPAQDPDPDPYPWLDHTLLTAKNKKIQTLDAVPYGYGTMKLSVTVKKCKIR